MFKKKFEAEDAIEEEEEVKSNLSRNSSMEREEKKDRDERELDIERNLSCNDACVYSDDMDEALNSCESDSDDEEDQPMPNQQNI